MNLTIEKKSIVWNDRRYKYREMDIKEGLRADCQCLVDEVAMRFPNAIEDEVKLVRSLENK